MLKELVNVASLPELWKVSCWVLPVQSVFNTKTLAILASGICKQWPGDATMGARDGRQGAIQTTGHVPLYLQAAPVVTELSVCVWYMPITVSQTWHPTGCCCSCWAQKLNCVNKLAFTSRLSERSVLTEHDSNSFEKSFRYSYLEN